MLSREIRQKFLKFFAENGHTVVPSSPSFPEDDQTLLFTNAGMNQFKDVFLGHKREYTQAVTAQKCIRVGGKHNDLDNVGHTARHMTFFEMLGNFSFGSYFKKEAIQYAFEVATTVFAFDLDKIWISVYEKDDEAFALWKTLVKEERICRIGVKDNFWQMGETGPCGPCSEMFFDQGTNTHIPSPKEDPEGKRFLEFWNLVFMQNNKDKKGKLLLLDRPCIDTGAGLERVVALKMGVKTIFETDILSALIHALEAIAKVNYDKSCKEKAAAFHVISDHIRMLSFAISDGARPGNIERGYVLRKVIRRAVRYGRLLDLHKPFLGKLLPTLIDLMGGDYPELQAASHEVAAILEEEEDMFFRTLKRGGSLLSKVISQTENKEISGEDAFKLKDTYGFPLEEILLIAKDNGLSVNLDMFQILEEKAKQLSRRFSKMHSYEEKAAIFHDFVKKHGKSTFVGYSTLTCEATVVALLVEDRFVDKMHTGQTGIVILDHTPFYAEKGGQVADMGTLKHHSVCVNVTDCQVLMEGVIGHKAKVEQGTLLVGEPVTAKVEKERRFNIARHHSATHLLHFALEKCLGSSVRQAGSLVEQDRLRFDFTYNKPISQQELTQIERLINETLWQNPAVKTEEIALTKAQKDPTIKQLFGEKYAARVRVVEIEGIGKELCSGTHVTACQDIQFFRIQKEKSIAKGVRRIEAVIGMQALALTLEKEDILSSLASFLGTGEKQLVGSVKQLKTECEQHKELLKRHRKAEIAVIQKSLLDKALAPHIVTSVPCTNSELISLANALLGELENGACCLANLDQDRCFIYICVSPKQVQKGISAQKLLAAILPIIEGKGGGKPASAQGSGYAKGLNQALEHIKNSFERLL